MRIEKLLDMVLENHPGTPQTGEARYYSRKDLLGIITIPDPGSLSIDELTKRLKAFGKLDLAINGFWYRVRRIEAVPAKKKQSGPVMFKSSDGVVVRARGRVERIDPPLSDD